MFSWEIEKFLSDRNYSLTKEEYFEITDISMNPQIARIRYNAFEDDFQIITMDGYSWIVRLRND